MKAALLKQIGASPTVEDVSELVAEAGDVVVVVGHAFAQRAGKG